MGDLERSWWASDRFFGGLLAAFLGLSLILAVVVTKAALDDESAVSTSGLPVSAGARTEIGGSDGDVVGGDTATAGPGAAGGSAGAGDSAGAQGGGRGAGSAGAGGGPIPPPPDVKVPAAEERQGVTESSVKIGAEGHLTGNINFKDTFDAPLAWVRMINDKGGINGRKLSYVFYDDGALDSNRAQENTRRLNEEDKIFAWVGGTTALTGEAVQPYITQHGLPWIGQLSGIPQYQTPVGFPSETYVAAACRQAAQVMSEQGTKKVALWRANSYISTDCINAIKIGLGKFKIEVVKEYFNPLGYPDYTSQLQEARSAGADTVFMGSESHDFKRWIDGLKRMNWKPRIINQFAGYSLNLLREGGLAEFAAGATFTMTNIAPGTLSNPEVALMRQAIDKYVPGATIALLTTTDWLAARLFEDALRALGPDVSRSRLMGWMAAQRAWDTRGFNLPLDNSKSKQTGFYRKGLQGVSVAQLKANAELEDISPIEKSPAGKDGEAPLDSTSDFSY